MLSSKPASYSYSLTCFQSGHHVVWCWPVECMMTSVWNQCANEWNVLYLITADISQYQWTLSLDLTLTVLDGIHQSFTLLLRFSLWGKHSSQSVGFLCRILSLPFWLAETAWMIDSPEALISMNSRSNYWEITVTFFPRQQWFLPFASAYGYIVGR